MVPASGASAQESTPKEPGLGIRLLEAPVALKDDPRAQHYIIDRGAAGTTIKRDVEVSNGTSQPVQPALYMAAASIKDGLFTVDQRGVRNEITDWSKISPASASLAPGARTKATVTIAVPRNAPDGEYYGAAVASLAPVGTDVKIAAGVGVRIYLSVGKGAVKSDFELTKLTASRLDDGRPVVTAKVRNTGERALDMGGDLKLSHGPGGIKAGPFAATVKPTLGVGETGDVITVLAKDTPKGPWDAVLTLRSGTIKHAVAGRILFPDIGSRPEDIRFHDLEKKKTFGALAGSLILLVLIALLVAYWRYRRRRAEEAAAV